MVERLDVEFSSEGVTRQAWLYCRNTLADDAPAQGAVPPRERLSRICPFWINQCDAVRSSLLASQQR